jgi:RNA polymerase sigma-70 factor (ECF subfamily)
VAEAIGGDPSVTSELVTEMGRVIRSRLQRRLLRSGVLGSVGEARFDVEDLCQDVFARLFERNARILRSWDPERGLSLANFVGLVAERHVGGLLRTRRVRLETATESEQLDALPTQDGAAHAPEHRELLEMLQRALAERLSEKGMAVYQLLFLEERSVEEVRARLALNASAIYAWRHRIRKQLVQVGTQLDLIGQSGLPARTTRAARAA